jgi:peptidoglycan/LPS O-acetylase OafA/YrhL
LDFAQERSRRFVHAALSANSPGRRPQALGAKMGLTIKLPRLRPASDELLHLDLMRFIAASGIVFHHSHEFFTPVAEDLFLVREQWAGLALFVDLFFVISGYVIAHIYHDRMNSLSGYGTFLQRRVGRLVPLHWLTLLLSISMWSTFVLLNTSTQTPSFRPKCIAETALLLHSFLSCGIHFNSLTWSISAEMVMYVAFPVFAIIGTRSAQLLLSVGIAFLIAMMTVAVSQHGWKWPGSSWIDLSPVLRALPSFVFGAALFYNRSVVSRLPLPGSILVVAISGLIAAMVFGVSQLLTLLIVYAVAVAAIAADLQGSPITAVRRLAPLGQLTYSIYMWHMILVLIFLNAFGSKLLHGHMLTAAIVASACYLCIFTISYFSFFFIETPARRWIDGIKLFKPAFIASMPP